MTSLTHLELNLENNSIIDSTGGIGNSLGKLINLSYAYLNLQNNWIGDSGGIEIGNSLDNLEKLSDLKLNLKMKK